MLCYNTGILFEIPQQLQAFMQTVSTYLTVTGTKHMSEYMNVNTVHKNRQCHCLGFITYILHTVYISGLQLM
jgi:hypothetical protein